MYCSLGDLTARLVAEQLTALCDDDGDGTADTAVVEAAIGDADAEVDARLAPRYAVPFETAPALVRSLSATLALARLYERRRETPSGEFRKTVEAARLMLERLAGGEADLRMEGVALGRAVSESTTRGEAPVFGDDDMAGY